jgi:SPP1 family predicted phage head-tail adaptor
MVIIQRYETVSNGMGGSFSQWTNHLEYDGVIDQLTGNEMLEADRIAENSTHILIGPMADIKRQDRVLFNGKRFDVKNVDNPMQMNRHLEILLQYEGGQNEV